MNDASALFSSANDLCAIHRCREAIALWEQTSSLCPGDSGVHYQLGFCYAGDCRAHSLRDPEIAIFHYRRALILSAKEDTIARAMVLGALGNAYLSASHRDAPRLLSAIHCYEEAADTYAWAARRDDWAREQFNLGNAWCEMPEAEFPEKWQQAIEHYERALSIRTRLRDARHYAATLQNLGTAYRELQSGDPPSNIRKAILCYHRAMRAVRGRAQGKRRADLHHNLGNAYLALARLDQDCVRNCSRSLRHFARALSVRTREGSPFDYAATQLSRGQALIRLAAHGVGEASNLQQARLSFVEAVDAFLESGRTELADEVRKNFALLVGSDIH
jgi:tetratricopeptide (TPR) repeat protein